MIESYIRYLETLRRYSPLTVRNYRRDIENFAGYMGVGLDEFDPRDVTPADAVGWIERLSAGGLKPSSVNRTAASVRSMFSYFVREGVLGVSPFRFVKPLKTPTKLPVYVAESSSEPLVGEMERLVAEGDFVQRRDALIVLLFYTSGIRLAELVGIDTTDFSEDFSRLTVHGKGDRTRVIPVMERTRLAIKSYVEKNREENICPGEKKSLFFTQRSERISRITVYRTVNRILESFGVNGKHSPHVLRHTFATQTLGGGGDIRSIQELMGHKSLQSTQIYTHTDIRSLKRVYATAHPRSRAASVRDGKK